MDDPSVAAREASLYERDFLAWTQEQADALRSIAAGGNARPDYENLIEEVESLGVALRHALGGRLATIIEHLAKLQSSPAALPRPAWRSTVRRERSEIERLLEQSPSLRNHLPAAVAREAPKATRRVLEELQDRGELTADAEKALLATPDRYDQEKVLGDWFPEPPA